MNSEDLRLIFDDLAEKAIQWEYSYFLAKNRGDEEMMAELAGTGEAYYGKLLDLQKTFPEIENKIFYYRYGRTVRDDLGDIQTGGIVTGDSPGFWGEDPEGTISFGDAFDPGSFEIDNDKKPYAVLSVDMDYLDGSTLVPQGGGFSRRWKFRDGTEYRRQTLFKVSVQDDILRETRVSRGNIDIDAAVRDAEFRMDGKERLLLGGYTVEQHALMGNVPDPLGYAGYRGLREDALAGYRAELEAKNTSYEEQTVYRGRIFTLSPQGYFVVDPDRKRIVMAVLETQPQQCRIVRTEYQNPYRVPRGEKKPEIREPGEVAERRWSETDRTAPDHAAAMLYLAEHYAEYMAPPNLSLPKPSAIRYPKVWCYFMRSVWLRQQGAVPE